MYIILTNGNIIYTTDILFATQGIAWSVPNSTDKSYGRYSEIHCISDTNPIEQVAQVDPEIKHIRP